MTAPQQVNRFEANLLAILRFTLGRGTLDGVRRVLHDPMVMPPCLSPNAVALVKDHLAKGVVLALTRGGGWRNEPFLQAGEPHSGRVWERQPLANRVLEFGPHTLGFLMWITAEAAKEPKLDWDPPAEELTAADELYLTLAFDALRPEPGLAALLRSKKTFRRNPLCLLAHPGDVAPGDATTAPVFRFDGPRGPILECLQPWLRDRWLTRERTKGQQQEWQIALAVGRAEHNVLNSFLTACETAGRWDLARFLTRTLSALFAGPALAPQYWVGSLTPGVVLRLAERIDVLRLVLTVPRAATTLDRWDRTMQGVGYFDDGYAASQLWKQEWERANGPTVVRRARQVVDAVEPLRSAP